MTRRWGAAAVVLLAALLPSGVSSAGTEERIAYTRVTSSGDVQLWTRTTLGDARMVADQDRPTFIGQGDSARWSPDGEWLLFVSGDGFESSLYKMRADGTDQTLVVGDTRLYGFDWSPDGSQVVFSDGTRLHIVDSEGRGPARVLPHRAGNCDQQPAWSPDGATIAYSSFPMRQGAFLGMPSCTAGISDTTVVDLFALSADGVQDQVRLTNSESVQETNARWSQDGQRLLVDGRKAGNFRRARLEVLTWDGPLSGSPARRRLVWSGRGELWGATWSPDERRIVFSLRPGNEENTDGELFTVRTNGDRFRQLTRNRVDDLLPDWGPQ